MSVDLKCENCGKTENLKYCTGCHKVVFCNADCLRAKWPEHKLVCTPKKNDSSEKPLESPKKEVPPPTPNKYSTVRLPQELLGGAGIFKEGYLSKRWAIPYLGRYQWHQRYFAFEKFCLIYYKNENERKSGSTFRARIPIYHIKSFGPVTPDELKNEKFKEGTKFYLIALQIGGYRPQTMILNCKGDDERSEWLKTLNEARDLFREKVGPDFQYEDEPEQKESSVLGSVGGALSSIGSNLGVFAARKKNERRTSLVLEDPKKEIEEGEKLGELKEGDEDVAAAKIAREEEERKKKAVEDKNKLAKMSKSKRLEEMCKKIKSESGDKIRKEKEGKLHVTVHIDKGEKLVKCDRFGKSDPYVYVSVVGQRQKCKTVMKSLAPKWDDKLHFYVDEVPNRIYFEVYDWDAASTADPMGWAYVDFKDEGKSSFVYHDLELHDIDSGKITVGIKCDPNPKYEPPKEGEKKMFSFGKNDAELRRRKGQVKIEPYESKLKPQEMGFFAKYHMAIVMICILLICGVLLFVYYQNTEDVSVIIDHVTGDGKSTSTKPKKPRTTTKPKL